MTAKNKKKSRRQGIVSKIMNIALIALTFARPIQLFVARGKDALPIIIREATFGLSEGKFKLADGLKMYTPAGAAAALGYLKSYAIKRFPVRK